MLITYQRNNQDYLVQTNGDNPYKEIGQCLLDADIPGYLIATDSAYGQAEFEITQRGTCFNRDGDRIPSMYVLEKKPFDIEPLPLISPQEKYLVCINPAKDGYGNYKFYLMESPVNGDFYCQFGRIGDESGRYGRRRTSNPYPERLFWIRYFEKLSKGYVDRTEEYHSESKKAPKTNDALFNKLYAFSKQTTNNVFINDSVTKKMLSEAKKCLWQMRHRKTVRGFNNQLLKLLTMIPRRVLCVQDWLASSEKDFGKIIEREENLMGALEGTTVADWGDIKVFPAREDQKEIVMKHLGDSLKGRVKNIYRVINPRTEKRYRDKNHGIRKKLFWHGSRNENWLSIIQNGLSLNPNARIIGKMLGDGIYFAPSPSKSFGYTSAHGTYWARGHSDTAFMALFETAYGKPYYTKTTRSFTAKEVKDLGANCVYAKRDDTWLRQDEVCFYNESDMTIMYLVEFEG